MHEFIDTLTGWLAGHPLERQVVYTAGLFLMAWGAHLLARKVLLRSVTHLIRASSTKMDDVLLSQGVLNRAALLLPSARLLLRRRRPARLEGDGPAGGQRRPCSWWCCSWREP